MDREAHHAIARMLEPEAERLERERASIARGLAEFAAGECFDDETVEAWLDLLESDPTAPLPSKRSQHTA